MSFLFIISLREPDIIKLIGVQAYFLFILLGKKYFDLSDYLNPCVKSCRGTS